MYQPLRSALQLLCCALTSSILVTGATAADLTLTASPNPARFGAPVTLTASVLDGATGKVTFYDGTISLGTGVISGNQATCKTVLLQPGIRSLRAHYQGSSKYVAIDSAVVQLTVVPGPSLGLLTFVESTISPGTPYSPAR
jgi:hypothetical protein